jgi:hypothetical protein
VARAPPTWIVVHDEVGAAERFAAVEGRLDPRCRAQRPCRPGRHPLGRAEAIGVDVVEDDLGVVQLRVGQEVPEQVPGEDDAAGADEDDPGHGRSSVPTGSAPTIWRRPWL